MGFKVVVMGDVVREAATERGLAPSPQTLGEVMLDLRSKEGPSAIADRCIPEVSTTHATRVLIEGLRSSEEVMRFKQEFGVFPVVAVHSSPESRYRRLVKRRRERPDDPTALHEFQERDKRELSVGLGDVVALADYHIVNEGSVEGFRTEGKKVLSKVVDDAEGRS